MSLNKYFDDIDSTGLEKYMKLCANALVSGIVEDLKTELLSHQEIATKHDVALVFVENIASKLVLEL